MEEELKRAEDRVSQFLNGGKCQFADHPASTRLEILIMLRQIRLAEPHVSTDLSNLEREIKKEARAASTH